MAPAIGYDDVEHQVLIQVGQGHVCTDARVCRQTRGGAIAKVARAVVDQEHIGPGAIGENHVESGIASHIAQGYAEKAFRARKRREL